MSFLLSLILSFLVPISGTDDCAYVAVKNSTNNIDFEILFSFGHRFNYWDFFWWWSPHLGHLQIEFLQIDAIVGNKWTSIR